MQHWKQEIGCFSRSGIIKNSIDWEHLKKFPSHWGSIESHSQGSHASNVEVVDLESDHSTKKRSIGSPEQREGDYRVYISAVGPQLYQRQSDSWQCQCNSWQLSSIVVGRDKSFSHAVQFYSIFHETLYCCTSKKMIWELRPWQVSVSSMPTCRVNF